MVSVSPCSSLLKLNPISISPPFFHNQPQSLTFNSFISSAKPLSFVSKPNRPANNNNYKNSIFSANSVAEQQENKQEEEFQVLTAARSEYNNIVILESANSKILLLDDSGNIHSILYKDQNQKWTDSYWDEFCSLPAIIPNGPVAIFGLGGGTVAHQLLHFWQHLVVHGWELDEILIDRARMFFGLSDLEQISDDSSSSTNAGILRVHVGDALSPTANVEGGYAGIIVDLFADAKVLPQLEVAQTWLDMREKLMPNGRIMVNCGGASDSEKDGWEVNFTIKALCEAFGQEFVNWKKMPQNESGNYLAFTGPLPEMDMWSRSVPGKLSSAVNQWRPCKPLSS